MWFPEILKKAEKFADTYLPGRVEKGKMTKEVAEAARKNISFTPDLKEAAKEADFVIEAATEVLDIKRKIFADLDWLHSAPRHPGHQQLVPGELARGRRHEKAGQSAEHAFFQPGAGDEAGRSGQRPPRLRRDGQDHHGPVLKMEKIPVLIKKEVEGFLLNRIFKVIGREALWMLEMGVASIEDIDKACVYGAGHPMGPFRLMDLTGIDLNYIRSMERFRETGDRADLPSPSVVEKIHEGPLRRKDRQGLVRLYEEIITNRAYSVSSEQN